MTSQEPSAAELFWRRRATLLAGKLNLHHGLARIIPKLFVVLVAAAIFELLRREMGGPFQWSGALLVFGTAVATGWAWLEARRHFCTAADARIRLETTLGLNNRLSAAEAGVVSWPAPPAQLDDGYIANWNLLLLPTLAGFLFFGAAHLVPVHHLRVGTEAGAISEPPELAQVQTWIDALKAEDLVEPEKLQEMQTALDKLREHPAQDWYTQGDLEAANSLKEWMAQSMNALSHDLDQADRAVEAMREKVDNSVAPGSLQPQQDELRKAGENLASGTLPARREITDALRGGEGAADKPLSAAQLKALHERLASGKLAAQTAPKTNGGLSAEMEQAMALAQGEGHDRRHGKRPGPGGLGGGTETAPLELQNRDKNTIAGPMTRVNNDDMSRAAFGETLKITSGEHTVNPKDYQGLQAAGPAQMQGSGGEAVWRSTYDPQEADTLARFFK